MKERKELEEKKSKEALLLVHKKHILMKYQNERDEARRLQRSGSSRGTRKEADLQDLLTMESCRSPAVDYFEEIRPEAPTKIQDEQEVTSEASWNATGEKRRRRVEAGTRRGNGDARNQSFMERSGSPNTLMVKVAMSGCK